MARYCLYTKILMLRKFRKKKNRRGTECVETAITLPLLMIAMFCTINITHRWHVEKMLKLATYEAIKAGCAKDGNSDDAIRVFTEHATALGIKDPRLTINKSRFDNANTGTLLYCRGYALTSRNQFMAPINLTFNRIMSGGYVYYRKEGL